MNNLISDNYRIHGYHFVNSLCIGKLYKITNDWLSISIDLQDIFDWEVKYKKGLESPNFLNNKDVVFFHFIHISNSTTVLWFQIVMFYHTKFYSQTSSIG